MSTLSSIHRCIAGLALLLAVILGVTISGVPPVTANPAAPEASSNSEVSSEEREEIFLNGDMWEFRPIKIPFYGWEEDDTSTNLDRSFIREAIEEVPDEDWETWTDVRVPSAWNNHHEFDYPDFWHHIHKGEYRRTFDVPESFDGKRVTLNFAGVNWKAWVYVNDTLVHAEGFEDEDFTHEFALTPFEVDITDLVEPGSEDNDLHIVVHDVTANMVGPSPEEFTVTKYPMGLRGQYWNRVTLDEHPRQWYEGKSGIFKDVSMTATPNVYVEDVFVRPDQDNDQITADITLHNEDSEDRTVTVDSSVVTWQDEDHALTFDEAPSVTVPAGERQTITVEQDWDDYELWWPDDPVLYSMVTRLLTDDGDVIDEMDDRFGVREVEAVESGDVDERGVYVNGVRTALLGESIEFNIRADTAGREAGEDITQLDGLTFNGSWGTTRSYFEEVIDAAKDMNINVLRIHRGWSLSDELVEIADEKGMMLIAENPVTYWGWEHPLTEPYYDNAISKVLEIAKNYRNNPSIVMWSISNENNHYNDDLEAGMRTGFNGEDPVNPDIQLVSAKNAVDGTDSEGYMDGYIPDEYDGDHTWFTYEENASYVQLTNVERRESVMDSLRIMRQQRMSFGYDAKILLAFYNFQKVFELPSSPTSDEPMQVEIPWTEEEINGPGYNAQYMWQSVMNPYSDPPTANYMDEFSIPSEELWATTNEPVAVFDQGWVDDAMHGTAATTSYEPERTLHLFNSDMTGDESTELTVDWRLLDSSNGSVIREDSFTEDVPIGSSRDVTVDTGEATSSSNQLELTVSKSGEERFSETLDFGPLPTQENPTGDVVTIDDGESGTHSQGLETSSDLDSTYGTTALMTEDVQENDNARFTPNIGSDGDHNVYVHVPEGLSGTQAVTVRWGKGKHKRHSATIDLGSPGWVEVPGGPFPFSSGETGNFAELVSGGTADVLVADAVTFQRVPSDTTEHHFDQRQQPGNGSDWEYLGRYPCESGTACRVALNNDASERVSADAVKFVGEGEEIILDEGQAELDGPWTRAGNKPDQVGGDMYYADPASPADAEITYIPEISEAGEFDVYITWDDNEARRRAVDAPVAVHTDPVDSSKWNVVDDELDAPAHWIEGGNGDLEWGDDEVRVSAEVDPRFYAITRNDFVAPTAPFSYEFTTRTHGEGSHEVSVRSDDYYTRVILNHGVSGTVTDSYWEPEESYSVDTTESHTYRVVVHEDYSYDLYVDGELAWSGAANKGSGDDVLKAGTEPSLTTDFTLSDIRVADEALVPKADSDVVESAFTPGEAEVEVNESAVMPATSIGDNASEVDAVVRQPGAVRMTRKPIGVS